MPHVIESVHTTMGNDGNDGVDGDYNDDIMTFLVNNKEKIISSGYISYKYGRITIVNKTPSSTRYCVVKGVIKIDCAMVWVPCLQPVFGVHFPPE